MKTLKLAVALLVLVLFTACSEAPPAPGKDAAADSATADATAADSTAADTAPASEEGQAFESGFESGDTSEWTEENSAPGEEENGGDADESPDT